MLFANNEFVEMFINVYLASFVNTLVSGCLQRELLMMVGYFQLALLASPCSAAS